MSSSRSDLISLCKQCFQPSDLCPEFTDKSNVGIFINRGFVDDVFGTVSIAQCAQCLPVVDVRRWYSWTKIYANKVRSHSSDIPQKYSLYSCYYALYVFFLVFFFLSLVLFGSKAWKLIKKYIYHFLFTKDTFNLSTETVNTFIMLQKKPIFK